MQISVRRVTMGWPQPGSPSGLLDPQRAPSSRRDVAVDSLAGVRRDEEAASLCPGENSSLPNADAEAARGIISDQYIHAATNDRRFWSSIRRVAKPPKRDGENAAIDLGAETADVRLDDVHLQIEVELPHLLRQHLSRHDPALAAQQKFDQPESRGYLAPEKLVWPTPITGNWAIRPSRVAGSNNRSPVSASSAVTLVNARSGRSLRVQTPACTPAIPHLPAVRPKVALRPFLPFGSGWLRRLHNSAAT